MPILLVLLLVASVLDLPWPAAAVPWSVLNEDGERVPAPFPPELTVGITAGLVALSVLATFGVSVWAALTLKKHPERRKAVARAYWRWRRVAFYLNLGIIAVALFALGWGHWVHAALRPSDTAPLYPFAELLVPGPYLLTLALNWFAYWPAERALARTAHPDRPFWSLFGFWLNHARLFFVPGFLLVLVCVTQQSAARLFPHTTGQWWYQVGVAFTGVGLATLLPLVIRPLLGLHRLPPGPVRDRLQATSKRLGVRFSDVLFWPTRGAMANAMVVGVIPWARYVILTDGLIDGLSPDELDAVYGHEAGHARYGHLPYYALFLLLSMAAIGGAAVGVLKLLTLVGWSVELPDSLAAYSPLPPLLVMGVYLFVVFGYLSRVCERQADIFGARTGSCGNPACEGHDENTVLVAKGKGLCPTGLRSMARALEKVLVLNGWDADHGRGGNAFRRLLGWVRAWQHGPLPARVDYLYSLTARPEHADRHDRKAFRVRVLLAAALFVVAVAGGVVGGSELLKWF